MYLFQDLRNNALELQRDQLIEEYNDPDLATLARKNYALSRQWLLENSYNKELGFSETQIQEKSDALKAFSEGIGSVFYRTSLDAVLFGLGHIEAQKYWASRIEIGYVEAYGFVPTIVQVEHGYVILFPGSFTTLISELVSTFSRNLGINLGALPIYIKEYEECEENFEESRRILWEALAFFFSSGMHGSLPPENRYYSPRPELDVLKDRTINFLMGHEFIHAWRGHFQGMYHPNRPLEWRHYPLNWNYEFEADIWSLNLCLRAEQVLYNLRRSDTDHQKDFAPFIHEAISDYALGANCCYDLIYIIEAIIGGSKNQRRHPPFKDRYQQWNKLSPRTRNDFHSHGYSFTYDLICRFIHRRYCNKFLKVYGEQARNLWSKYNQQQHRVKAMKLFS